MIYLVGTPIPDVEAAEKVLLKHPVYRWLAEHIRCAVDIKTDSTRLVQFHRLRILVEHIPRMLLPRRTVRTDKRRKTASDAVQRVQKSIYGGVLSFADSAREELLEELLAEATQILKHPQRRPKSVKYWDLHQLADALYEQTGTADVQLLLQVAAACNLQCDERTAQRYAAAARTA